MFSRGVSCRLKNLLPQDTRAAEIASALSFIAFSFSLVFGFDQTPDLFYMAERKEVWIILCFIIGSLQILSIMLDPELILLRVIMSWAAGYFLLWEFTSHCSTFLYCAKSIHIDDLTQLFIGIGNLIAFVINLGFMREKWKL